MVSHNERARRRVKLRLRIQHAHRAAPARQLCGRIQSRRRSAHNNNFLLLPLGTRAFLRFAHACQSFSELLAQLADSPPKALSRYDKKPARIARARVGAGIRTAPQYSESSVLGKRLAGKIQANGKPPGCDYVVVMAFFACFSYGARSSNATPIRVVAITATASKIVRVVDK